MENIILFTQLNDFIFCPMSIYFHNLYGDMEDVLFQSPDQLNGKSAHSAIDERRYSDKKTIMQGTELYCDKYKLRGKIDIFDTEKGILTERKKKITTIYDGYIFQLYAQYFSLCENGYTVKEIRLYSMDNNKVHRINKPEEDPVILQKFEKTINDLQTFVPNKFIQTNIAKCQRCIYEPACDRSVHTDDECQ
ncbi:MAG: type V CRISPR-associated protein Cas4 [Synergistaceae bacterium]